MKTFRPIFVAIITLLAVQAAPAQTTGNDPVLLFPEFEDGIITTRTGGSSPGKFNYSIVDGTVLMFQDGEARMIADPGEIGSVKIGDRMFIQVGASDFYEKIKVADNRHLYVKWLGSIKFKGKQAAYGQSSHTSSTKQYSLADGRQLTQASEDYEVIPKNLYYLNIEGKYRPFSSAKTLAKIFKENKAGIMEYAEREKTDFRNVGDVVKLLEHFGTSLGYR